MDEQPLPLPCQGKVAEWRGASKLMYLNTNQWQYLFPAPTRLDVLKISLCDNPRPGLPPFRKWKMEFLQWIQEQTLEYPSRLH